MISTGGGPKRSAILGCATFLILLLVSFPHIVAASAAVDESLHDHTSLRKLQRGMETSCPIGDTPCTKEYKPVVCGDCEYDNQCLATAADSSFTSDTCKPKTCPLPALVPCTKIYKRVICDGCVYDNQCLATAAKDEFTSDTCSPI